MNKIELVVGRVDGYSVIPITLAWANILKGSNTVETLKSIVISNGIDWNKVMYAHVEMIDPDYGFESYNLLDR